MKRIKNRIKSLNINQIGFNKGKGCELNLIKLQQKLEYWKHSGRQTNSLITTIHLDIAAAFDSVPHKELYKQMHKKGYSEEIINTIKWLYNQTKINIDDELISIKKGVIQGGILSPKLFNIFYDTLLDKLERVNLFMIAYADDVVIATKGVNQITLAIKTTNE